MIGQCGQLQYLRHLSDFWIDKFVQFLVAQLSHGLMNVQKTHTFTGAPAYTVSKNKKGFARRANPFHSIDLQVILDYVNHSKKPDYFPASSLIAA